jgi:NTP pyrophosphatase (non-canonical NTP hydrolase)
MDLNEYQKQASRTDQRPGKDERAMVYPLIGLASEVGSLLNLYKKRVRDGEVHALFSERVTEELGDVLWYVANLAGKLDLSLGDIAQTNLRRLHERWAIGSDTGPASLLDDGFPDDQRLPRRASVAFVQTYEEGRLRVRLIHEGNQLGDPLSDMAWEEDDYRFHDAFHLTYATVLGWSPITRAFFGRQRVSNPRMREIEDSGRAKVVEEAIAALAFEYAREVSFLEGVQQLDLSFLQTVRNMASHFEVRIRTFRDWEMAILRSFEMWRALRDHGGGILHLDLPARSIRFEASFE